MFKRGDLTVGLASILIALFIILQSRNLVVRTSLDPAGPTFVPLIIAWGMIFIGIILIAGALYVRRVTPAPAKGGAGLVQKFNDYKYVLMVVALSLAYAALLDVVGYLIMTPILIGGIMWVLNVRDIKEILKVSIPVSVILYVVFRFGLQVKLPLGFLSTLVNGG